MKKLYRSKDAKKLCGVCAGIAEYLGIDPTIIRVAWIVLTVLNFIIGIVLYFLLVIVIPQDEGFVDTTCREKKDD